MDKTGIPNTVKWGINSSSNDEKKKEKSNAEITI